MKKKSYALFILIGTILIYLLIIFFQSDNIADALWPYIVFAGLLILYAIVSLVEWYKK